MGRPIQLRIMRLGISAALGLAGLFSVVISNPSIAAENGAGVYLLGSRGPLAGVTPPPGLYFQNDLYLYSGDAGTSVPLPIGGKLTAGLKVSTWLEMPTVVWSTPLQIFGGNLAFAATVPIGGPSVSAKLGLFPSSPGSSFVLNKRDSISAVGDPIFSSFVGWHAGNFHWTAGALLNVPVGEYHPGKLANISAHRWAVDTFGAITWLDKTIGLDLSAAAGFTFNGRNDKTDYTTGTEFHLEFSATQYLSEAWSVGLVGYHYQQISGDTGTGALLGPLKGRVTALGGTVGYNFKIGEFPVSARLKIYREFNVQHRLEGTGGFFTFVVPIL